MVRQLLDERPPSEGDASAEMEDGGATQLRSSFFSPERVARHQQMIREMQGRLHGGHL